jgi:hypothetical protein
MELANFDLCKRIKGHGYRGHTGKKFACLYDNDIWMVKFSRPSKEVTNGFSSSHIPSSISEFIGSYIYKSLGIDVHETILGYCEGEIVVGCKDFAINARLLEYVQIKNTVAEEFILGSYGSSQQGELLADALNTINFSEDFTDVKGRAIERFWDMFVIDAFIHNINRNNENWGLLINGSSIDLAPVYDNGDAFFCGANFPSGMAQTEKEVLIKEAALAGWSFFLENNGKKINPLEYMKTTENKDCLEALKRFSKRLNLNEILAFIQAIPNEAFGLVVISDEQKSFCKSFLKKTYEDGILPVLKQRNFHS